MAKGYTWKVHPHPGGHFSHSWAVLDPAGRHVKFGSSATRAGAILAAEKAIWRLEQAAKDSSRQGKN
jgi:hypothetical protein